MRLRSQLLAISVTLLSSLAHAENLDDMWPDRIPKSEPTTVDVLKSQQDVRMATLMADYVRLSTMLVNMKFASSAGMSVNGITDPTMQMLAKSGVIALDLSASSYGIYKTYTNGRSIYTKQAALGSAADPEKSAFEKKGRAGRVLARMKAAGMPAAKTAIWGGAVVYFWRQITPILLLDEKDFAEVLAKTEADLAIVDAQLSEQARVFLGLAPRANPAGDKAELFKID